MRWVALLLVAAGVALVASVPRGIRNHNPGNIRRSGDDWLGLAPVQTDPDYFQFASPIWGLRAVARVLDTYRRRYGLDTVREIITRYAPHRGNPTENYVEFVAEWLGVSPDESIDVAARTPDLIDAIVRFEQGQQPFSRELILEAVELARA